MLESYDDTGGCAASIIGLVGLIAFTVCMWNAYPTKETNDYDKGKQYIEYDREVEYEYNHERKCGCYRCGGGLDE